MNQEKPMSTTNVMASTPGAGNDSEKTLILKNSDRSKTADKEAHNSRIPAPVPEEFLCAITFTVMEDPLMTRSGLSFERAAILGWLDKKSYCPATGEPLLPSMLVPNVALRLRIYEWRLASKQSCSELKADAGNAQEGGEEDVMVSSDDNSWCWDFDLYLKLSPEELPKEIQVPQTATKNRKAMESSKQDKSLDVSPLPVMRKTGQQVLKAARSA